MEPEKLSDTNSKFIFVHTIIVCFLYPLIFFALLILIPVASIPLLIIRWAIEKAAHRKTDFVGLGEMVNTTDSLFLRDSIYSNPKCNCVITFTVEGNLKLSRIRETFRDKVLNATSSDGSLKYPKFRQYLKQWCGYSFWSDVLDFDVEDQINLHQRSTDGKLCNDKVINELIQELVNQPWGEGQPLWDINLVANYQPADFNNGQSYSCIIFRMYHILGDGFTASCILKDWLSIPCETQLEELDKKDTRNNTALEWIRKVLWNVTLPFNLVFHATEMLAIILSCDSEWFVPQHRQTGKCWIQSTGPIPIKLIKDIKNHFGVNFNSVLWAVQTGAHREVLKTREKPVPEFLPSATSILLPGHPGKMANHSVVSIIKLPLSEEDPVVRLFKCHEEEKQTKTFVGAIFTKNWIQLCGLFPPKVIKCFLPSILAFVTSNISFNDLELYGDADSKSNFITGISGTSGLQIGTHGIFIASISYNDQITFNTTVDRALMGEKESLQFSEAIIHQINTLHQLVD